MKVILNYYLRFKISEFHRLITWNTVYVYNGLKTNDPNYYYKIKLHNGFNLQAQKQHIHAIKLSKSRLHRLKKIKEQTIVIQILSDSLTPFKYAKKHLKFHLDAKKYYIRAMGHDMYSPILKPMINKILNFLS